MVRELSSDAVTEHNQGSTTEQSSNDSTTSLSEVSDMDERTEDAYRRRNDKDKRDISSGVFYNLSSPPAECGVLAVSVSHPPNNALHLHLSSAENIHALEPSAASDGFLDNSSSISPNPDGRHTLPRPPYRVRFRSRVRIASGAHHHSHPHSYPHTRPPSQRASQSAESVDSESSLCSSISAPLRCTPDESEARSSYSYTVSTVPKNKRRRPRKPPPSVVASLPARLNSRSEPGERAPLLRAPGSRLGARTRRLYGDPDPDEEHASPRRRLAPPAREDIDAFGRWPWRLLNGYWWAWKCGSAVGCCCPADGDEDESEDEQHQEQQEQQRRHDNRSGNGGSGC